jgi:hypothetical protein
MTLWQLAVAEKSSVSSEAVISVALIAAGVFDEGITRTALNLPRTSYTFLADERDRSWTAQERHGMRLGIAAAILAANSAGQFGGADQVSR